MSPFSWAPVLTAGFLISLLVLMELGRRLGIHHLAQDSENARAGLGVVDGAIFGLIGLLVAFTFSGAASRFEGRQHLIIEEANDIGTAYLRLDVLPPETHPALRDLFRRYVDSRLEMYRSLPDPKATRDAMAKSARLQNEIWTLAVAACRKSEGQPTAMLVLPALNQMIDITTTRTMAAHIHPPMAIMILLGALVLVGALLAGYGMAAARQRSWIHILGYAVIMTAAVYIILDFEYPRLGLIRVNEFDRVLVELRNSMK